MEKPAFLREDLWKEAPQDDLPRVGILLDEVRLTSDECMIPTSVLESIPELSGHPLVSFRQGTQFRLSADHAAGLFRAWGSGFSPEAAIVGAATEGARVLVTHRRIERNRKLIEDKKADFRREHGRLFCEVCSMDFREFYGPLWNERAIEVHHLNPLGELDEACRTTLQDLILACSNCHSLLHQTADVAENLRRLRQHFGSDGQA